MLNGYCWEGIQTPAAAPGYRMLQVATIEASKVPRIRGSKAPRHRHFEAPTLRGFKALKNQGSKAPNLCGSTWLPKDSMEATIETSEILRL